MSTPDTTWCIIISVSISILFCCLLLHSVQHFRFRCCTKHRRRGQCPCGLVGTGEEGFDFLPLSFVLYSSWALFISVLIVIQYTTQHAVDPSTHHSAGHRNISGGPQPAIHWIVIYSVMALSGWEWLFNFYRFFSTHSASRKMRILHPAEIVAKFSIFGMVFMALFLLQIHVIFWLFPVLVFVHFAFNAVMIWLFAHILIVQYRFSMATQQYLHHLHDEMLHSVYMMRRLSLCSTICSSVTLSLITSTSNSNAMAIDTHSVILYVPPLWTLSAIAFTLNFVRNRIFLHSVTEPLRICCSKMTSPSINKLRLKIRRRDHSQTLNGPNLKQLRVPDQSVPLEMTLDVATSSVPTTLPALRTIESGQEFDDDHHRHDAFAHGVNFNPMETIKENEIDSKSNRDRSASPNSGHSSFRSDRSHHSPSTPAHPPSIVLSPSPNEVLSHHHRSPNSKENSKENQSRSRSPSASRWYQQIKSRISTPLAITLHQQLSPQGPHPRRSQQYRRHGQSAPVQQGQIQSVAHDQSTNLDLNLSPIDTVPETPTHSKALQLLGVGGGGITPSVAPSTSKRMSHSMMNRKRNTVTASYHYAPPTTPIPSLFVHLQANHTLNRSLFPSAPSPGAIAGEVTPRHAASARADYNRNGADSMSGKRESDLVMAALSKSDPVRMVEHQQSSTAPQTPKSPKSPFSRKKKENELSLLEMNGSPFPFAVRSDGDLINSKDDEPPLERSKSSGHLRKTKMVRDRSASDGDDVGLGMRSMSERRGGHRIDIPEKEMTSNSNQRNELSAPDVVHLFKVLSQHGLYPKNRVNDAQQLRDYHLKM